MKSYQMHQTLLRGFARQKPGKAAWNARYYAVRALRNRHKKWGF